jgi:predicted tellurium resistance membrane protein TerC
VKKAIVVAVVVLLVVVGVPLLMPGMADAHCSTCGPATLAMTMCMAVLAAAVAGVALESRRTSLRRRRLLALLRATFFDRPPQLAALQ